METRRREKDLIPKVSRGEQNRTMQWKPPEVYRLQVREIPQICCQHSVTTHVYDMTLLVLEQHIIKPTVCGEGLTTERECRSIKAFMVDTSI